MKNLYYLKYIVFTIVAYLATNTISAQNQPHKSHGCQFNHADDDFLPAINTTNSNARIAAIADADTSIFNFQSRPGASNVIFIDMNPPQNSLYMPSVGVTYSFINIWTYLTSAYKKEVMEIISRDYEIFDVNVTSNRAVYNSFNKSKRTRVILADVTNNNDQWQGVAAGIGVTSWDTTHLVDLQYAKGLFKATNTGSATSHEIGHYYGLSHDGNGSSAYYIVGSNTWGPIMGSASTQYMTWNNGDYSGATNKEDDIAILGSKLGFAKDDKTGYPLAIHPTTNIIDPKFNYGIISKSTDIDTFTVTLSSTGSINLQCSPINTLFFTNVFTDANLDVELVLLNSSFVQIAQNNTAANRSATLVSNSLAAGTYYILVKSGAESGIFSNYGSFGSYNFSGTITGSNIPTNNLIVSNLTGVQNRKCSSQGITPQINITNYGSQTISNVTIKQYLGGNLIKTQNEPVNITSGQSQTITLSAINTAGNNTLKIEASIPNETILIDNEISSPIAINEGKLVRLETDMLNYAGIRNIKWNITNLTSTFNINSEQFPVYSLNTTTIAQDFCLPNDCYNINLTGNFNICSENYKVFKSGTAYQGGDKVAYNGFVFQAKYYTTNIPSTSSADWTMITTCNKNASYKIAYKDENNTLLFTPEFTSSGFSGNATKSFCFNTTTTTALEDENLANEIVVSPNPSNDKLYINSAISIQNAKIFSIEGKLLLNLNDNVSTIDIQSLEQGIYILVLQFNNQNRSIKIIKN